MEVSSIIKSFLKWIDFAAKFFFPQLDSVQSTLLLEKADRKLEKKSVRYVNHLE